MPACEQLTLVLSDMSPIDIASYLYLFSNVSLLHVVGNVISKKSGLKRKLKVSTVDIQIKRSGLILKFSALVMLCRQIDTGCCYIYRGGYRI